MSENAVVTLIMLGAIVCLYVSYIFTESVNVHRTFMVISSLINAAFVMVVLLPAMDIYFDNEGIDRILGIAMFLISMNIYSKLDQKMNS